MNTYLIDSKEVKAIVKAENIVEAILKTCDISGILIMTYSNGNKATLNKDGEIVGEVSLLIGLSLC
jgi:hypothetical protein